MYVLIDMEWVTNRHGNHWPTQLAAIRVDEEWQTVDSFSVLFRPKDITFQKWDHMAFSGWTRDNFLNADSLYPALDAFEHWLQPEDILCWWHQEAYDLYIMFTKVAQIRDRVSMPTRIMATRSTTFVSIQMSLKRMMILSTGARSISTAATDTMLRMVSSLQKTAIFNHKLNDKPKELWYSTVRNQEQLLYRKDAAP